MGTIDEVDRSREKFLVDRFHTFLGERARVVAFLLAPRTEPRIVARCNGRRSSALQHAAWAELRPEGGILGIVGMLGLILGIQMIKVAEELVEAVHRRQEFVAIA